MFLHSFKNPLNQYLSKNIIFAQQILYRGWNFDIVQHWLAAIHIKDRISPLKILDKLRTVVKDCNNIPLMGRWPGDSVICAFPRGMLPGGYGLQFCSKTRWVLVKCWRTESLNVHVHSNHGVQPDDDQLKLNLMLQGIPLYLEWLLNLFILRYNFKPQRF